MQYICTLHVKYICTLHVQYIRTLHVQYIRTLHVQYICTLVKLEGTYATVLPAISNDCNARRHQAATIQTVHLPS